MMMTRRCALPLMNDSSRAAPATLAGLDRRGLITVFGAFLIWGLIPLYLKLLQSMPVLQIAAHRITWGCVFCMALLLLQRRGGEVLRILKDPKIRWRLALSALLIGTNWTLYVWAVDTNRVVEASLGYFINPLLNVLLGVVVLKERLNRMQWAAIALAALGVLYLTVNAGYLPWLSLVLALSFAFYGLVRKLTPVEALSGFAVESIILTPACVAYLVWCEIQGVGVMQTASFSLMSLLLLSGPVSAVPLVLFAAGAKRLPYSTVGLMQYIAPTMVLLIAVLIFREPFDMARMICFGLIWAALALYVADSLWRSRKTAHI